ncbi:MAG TPA: hypothetical protein VEK07_17345 [Polyangiaceae bacterium]|nr:hypothetical protein [Polyangiaceae bacterium]
MTPAAITVAPSTVSTSVEGTRASEGGLIQEHGAVFESQVGWHEVAEADVHEIAVDEVLGGELRPPPVPPHPSHDAKARAEQGESIPRPRLLDEADDGVQQEQGDDDQRFNQLLKRDLEHERGLEHPGDWAAQLFKERARGVGTSLGDGVGPVGPESRRRFRGRQPWRR